MRKCNGKRLHLRQGELELSEMLDQNYALLFWLSLRFGFGFRVFLLLLMCLFAKGAPFLKHVVRPPAGHAFCGPFLLLGRLIFSHGMPDPLAADDWVSNSSKIE